MTNQEHDLLVDMNSYVTVIFTELNVKERDQYIWISQIGNRTVKGKYIDVEFTFPLTNDSNPNNNITFNMTCFFGRLVG